MVLRRTRARADAEPARLAWLRTLVCCAPGCDGTCGPVEAHHHCLYGAGMARKAPDAKAMPLGRDHHRALHERRGPFAGMSRDDLRAWQDEQVAIYQARYALEARAELARLKAAQQ